MNTSSEIANDRVRDPADPETAAPERAGDASDQGTGAASPTEASLDRLKEQAVELGRQGLEKASELTDKIAKTVEKNPWSTLIIAAGIGLGIGVAGWLLGRHADDR